MSGEKKAKKEPTAMQQAIGSAVAGLIILPALYYCTKTRDEPEGSETTAYIDCRALVRASARFPSKVDFHRDTKTDQKGTRYHVHGTVDLMNGIGAMVPHAFSCSYDTVTKEATLLGVVPGGL